MPNHVGIAILMLWLPPGRDGAPDAGAGARDVHRVGRGRLQPAEPPRQGHRAESRQTRKEKEA